MTENESRQIQILRAKQFTCAQIADETGMPLNTVKSYLRRHPVDAQSVCLQCGKPVIQTLHRKEKKFCSDNAVCAGGTSIRSVSRTELYAEKPVCTAARNSSRIGTKNRNTAAANATISPENRLRNVHKYQPVILQFFVRYSGLITLANRVKLDRGEVQLWNGRSVKSYLRTKRKRSCARLHTAVFPAGKTPCCIRSKRRRITTKS